MEEKILKLAGNLFGLDLDKISIEMNRESIPEWDSLAHVQLIVQFEEEFKKQIPFEDIENIRCLKDFMKYV